jgi:hypothetical protein
MSNVPQLMNNVADKTQTGSEGLRSQQKQNDA